MMQSSGRCADGRHRCAVVDVDHGRSRSEVVVAGARVSNGCVVVKR